MNMGLEGKVALVLASSSGLGKAIATELAREGANVVISSTNEEKLKVAKGDIKESTGKEPLHFVCDVTKSGDIEKLISFVVQKYGTIHVLVNNAGGPPPGRFEDFPDDVWQRAFELTLLSFVRTTRLVLPYMKKMRWGRILNSTSSSVREAIDNLILSNTFRLGVVGMTKTLAREVALYNILVNVIGPGRFKTDRIEQLDKAAAERQNLSPEEVRSNMLRQIPMGRYGDPREYGRLAAFLCSEANSYITGQTIIADGGMLKAVP
ncbi:SDR family oxidoreductase [Acetomicrobium hydrogeniformans]|uniref:SDR family oxidoreductase n=1 Tax=Acetomicrobium hydrogeniformans TaxID=649746 RepID=A0A7V6ZE47_9BACT|nr:SDR family oxidoreductase [Acetomicrobium hydrogeniformans]HHZ04314.1 SDR family oxidoreductase [Acetomicrobium hydrogeniformans]